MARLAFAYGLLTIGALYAIAYLLLGAAMLPLGAGWALGLLYAVAFLLGKLLPLTFKRLPPLLGMLTAGLLLRNLPGGAIDTRAAPLLLGHEFSWWSRWIRAAALAVIMLRAGLGLDLDKLRTLGLSTARLAFLPCLSEALVVLGLSGPLLGLPPAWGGTLGFVLAAVSPAVVVPGMLDLGARGYGVAKGVPTMVVAAASFDDVLAIAGFGVCLALAAGGEAASAVPGDLLANATNASQGGSPPAASVAGPSVAWLVLKAPVELLAGVGVGLTFGALVAGPSNERVARRMGALQGEAAADLGAAAHFRAALAGALLSVIGGKRADFSGGGALGAIVLGATASRLWPVDARKAVQARINATWLHMQPALFSLLGAAVDVRAIDPSQLGGGLAVIAVALSLRILVTRLALIGSGLNAREARLVCVAWLPKATVQAAVGGAALDLMQERGYGAEAVARGRLVLMLSVLVILLTAPIGAIGIATLGPLWLTKDGAQGDAESAGSASKEEAAAAAASDHAEAPTHAYANGVATSKAAEPTPDEPQAKGKTHV